MQSIVRKRILDPLSVLLLTLSSGPSNLLGNYIDDDTPSPRDTL